MSENGARNNGEEALNGKDLREAPYAEKSILLGLGEPETKEFRQKYGDGNTRLPGLQPWYEKEQAHFIKDKLSQAKTKFRRDDARDFLKVIGIHPDGNTGGFRFILPEGAPTDFPSEIRFFGAKPRTQLNYNTLDTNKSIAEITIYEVLVDRVVAGSKKRIEVVLDTSSSSPPKKRRRKVSLDKTSVPAVSVQEAMNEINGYKTLSDFVGAVMPDGKVHTSLKVVAESVNHESAPSNDSEWEEQWARRLQLKNDEALRLDHHNTVLGLYLHAFYKTTMKHEVFTFQEFQDCFSSTRPIHSCITYHLMMESAKVRYEMPRYRFKGYGNPWFAERDVGTKAWLPADEYTRGMATIPDWIVRMVEKDDDEKRRYGYLIEPKPAGWYTSDPHAV